jgi:hypothetical protein
MKHNNWHCCAGFIQLSKLSSTLFNSYVVFYGGVIEQYRYFNQTDAISISVLQGSIWLIISNQPVMVRLPIIILQCSVIHTLRKSYLKHQLSEKVPSLEGTPVSPQTPYCLAICQGCPTGGPLAACGTLKLDSPAICILNGNGNKTLTDIRAQWRSARHVPLDSVIASTSPLCVHLCNAWRIRDTVHWTVK